MNWVQIISNKNIAQKCVWNMHVQDSLCVNATIIIKIHRDKINLIRKRKTRDTLANLQNNKIIFDSRFFVCLCFGVCAQVYRTIKSVVNLLLIFMMCLCTNCGTLRWSGEAVRRGPAILQMNRIDDWWVDKFDLWYLLCGSGHRGFIGIIFRTFIYCFMANVNCLLYLFKYPFFFCAAANNFLF